MSRKLILGTVVLALFAGGCALLARHRDGGPEVASHVVVEYYVSGGVMGANEHLTIYNDGRATLESPDDINRFRVSAVSMRKIKDVLERTEWPQDSSEPEATVADAFVYSIDYEDHEITVVEPGVPMSLRPVTNALNQIVFGERS